MEKVSHRKIIISAVLVITSLIIGWSCTKKAEFVNPPTRLRIQVFYKAPSGVIEPLKGVQVGIFSDSTEYNNQKYKYGVDAADFMSISDSLGYAYFDTVQSNVKYYVLCKYDSTVNKQILRWSNAELSYQFLNPLKENSFTTAQVIVSESDGIVNFKTANMFAYKNPLFVIMGGNDTVATLNDTASHSVVMNAGAYKYYAKSNYGCAWTGTLDVIAGVSVTRTLELCTAYPVYFGVGSNAVTAVTSNAVFPVTVVVDGKDTLATKLTKASTGCNSAVSVNLQEGTHTYQFIDSDDKVVIGTFSVSNPNQTQGSNCVQVYFK